jgi:hypothetical protein
MYADACVSYLQVILICSVGKEPKSWASRQSIAGKERRLGRTAGKEGMRMILFLPLKQNAFWPFAVCG